MLENTDKEDKKAASTTTSPPPSKSKVNKIEVLKKSLKENNIPRKSDVKSQNKDNIPKKSDVKSQNKDNTPKKSDVKGQSEERSTTWTFLVYPESAPSNWVDILKGLHVPFIVSPLHDKDIKNKDTGELKKPHYHCIIRFKSKKSFTQVQNDVCNKVNGPIPQPVADIAMMIRYLVHLDDPDKYQYNREDIRAYGNIDVKEYLYTKKEYQYEILKEILDFCQVYDVQEYSTIVNYSKDERPAWFPYVTKVFRATIDSYVRSQRYAAENGTN